jgi:hypothetical protein
MASRKVSGSAQQERLERHEQPYDLSDDPAKSRLVCPISSLSNPAFALFTHLGSMIVCPHLAVSTRFVCAVGSVRMSV